MVKIPDFKFTNKRLMIISLVIFLIILIVFADQIVEALIGWLIDRFGSVVIERIFGGLING